ncbi:MAG: peptide-methionine (R)-S-oxide reductase, partial [Rhodothalassiaceae bacterium]
MDERDRGAGDDPWRERLTPEQYYICRQGGTEPPFSGRLLAEKRDGMFHCAACGAALFQSGTKYDSGSGWPSFFAPAAADAVRELRDESPHALGNLAQRLVHLEAVGRA